jgi:hypothetical protein
MIAKTYFFPKTLCTYSINILRREKSLPDHAGRPYPAFRLTQEMSDMRGPVASEPLKLTAPDQSILSDPLSVSRTPVAPENRGFRAA